IGEFRRRYGEITLEIKHSNRFVDLVEERFDAAIRISAPLDSSLVMRKLAVIPMVFCASPEYLLRRGRPRTPADLRDHDCLIYTGSARPQEWQVLGADGRPEGIAVNGGLRTDNDHTLRQVALDGGGIVRMPRLFLNEELRNGRLVQLWPDDIALPVTLAVVYSSRRDLPRKVRAFIDFLVECRGEWGSFGPSR
ncbi:MAG: substrate binding domain-containing protein, partial [Wenzhouxiangellaceae bacterium]